MRTDFNWLILLVWSRFLLVQGSAGTLDSVGRIHIPIGVPNTVDSLKTFVEAEGSFSPGVGSYGIYFWVWDENHGRLFAPTDPGVATIHGLDTGGLLIPWSEWRFGMVLVRSEICQSEIDTPGGRAQIVAQRVRLLNEGGQSCRLKCYAVVRPLGPAGGPVRQINVAEQRFLLVDGHAALIGSADAQATGVGSQEEIIELASHNELPLRSQFTSENGQGAGALRYNLVLNPGQAQRLNFICPVHPGRAVQGHRWDGVSPWAQYDLNPPWATTGGRLQPDPGLGFYRRLRADDLFDQARRFWGQELQRATLDLPDARWSDSFEAIHAHCAMSMNAGAPDVAVVNYNVFNRDGMYVANIFQKTGNFKLAESAIDYFLTHPFNGRVQPEADNPGQILWAMGEHWKFTRDRAWLKRVYHDAQKIAAMIRYYRTTPGPHWVCDTRLEFGEDLAADQRQELKPGACDGFNPAYTEAYDVAGLRAATELAIAAGNPGDANAWTSLAEELFRQYDTRFSTNLTRGYGSYSVLWPCRLYPADQGKAHEQFKNYGAQSPTDWRYFPLARAHQGLLTGNREAGCKTLDYHLAQDQMQGWYAFDEGGPSGVGGWHQLRGFSSWAVHPKGQGNRDEWAVAMPHGWAIAEFHLLLRDSLVFEENQRLVLFAGIHPSWFWHPHGMKIKRLPTHFGLLSLTYSTRSGSAELHLAGSASPPAGFALRMPKGAARSVTVAGKSMEINPNGDCALPTKTRAVTIELAPQPAP
jgi:hypothetical protein